MNNSVTIVPYRYIPFDIGCNVDSHLKAEINNYLLTQEMAAEIKIDSLSKTLSNDILSVYQIKDNVKIYLYKYGIAVFTIDDSAEVFDSDNYAYEYCLKRKSAHEEYLTLKNSTAIILYQLAERIRDIASGKKDKLRISASNIWEHNGFSYVMTVSNVNLQELDFNYKEMTEKAKKNLHIMLEPSIAHAEDSLVYSTASDFENNSLEIDLSSLEEPTDWIKSSGFPDMSK